MIQHFSVFYTRINESPRGWKFSSIEALLDWIEYLKMIISVLQCIVVTWNDPLFIARGLVIICMVPT